MPSKKQKQKQKKNPPSSGSGSGSGSSSSSSKNPEKQVQTQTQQKKVQAQEQTQTQQKQGSASSRGWFTSIFRKKSHTYETLQAEVASNFNKFEEIKKTMGEFSFEGFDELHNKLKELNDKLKNKPSDADFKTYLDEYEKISAQMGFSKDKAIQLIKKMIDVRQKINAAANENEKKKHEEELKKLNKQFDDLIHQRRGAFYNQWWFKLLVGIVIIIGVLFIIGVIVGFIYAYHAESMHFSKTGEWSNARIIKRSAMNWVYVAIFWSQYGIW